MTESRYEEVRQSARRVLTELGSPNQTQKRCLSLLNDRRTKEILTEENVDGIIAGAIYIAAILTENRLTQHQLTDVLNISQATIRRYYVILVKLLELKKKKT